MKKLALSIEKARDEARLVLSQLERNSGDRVDVEEIAAMLGIEIERVPLEDESISGFLKQEDQNSKIVVNQNHGDKRQRFTIAHEIGHHVLHPFDSLHVDNWSSAQYIHFRNDESSQATKLIEIEANQFAAELLMPSAEIIEIAKNMTSNNPTIEPDDLIKELSDRYDVSLAAMTIKLGTAN